MSTKNWIITKNRELFTKIGNYNYCELTDMILPKIIGTDTETTHLEPRKGKLFSIQIGTGIHNYIIDLQNYSIGKEGLTPQDVFPFLEGKTMIFHNSLFDLGWFYSEGFFPENILDTMLQSKILYNGDVENQRNDFGAVMYRELGIRCDKEIQKNIATIKLSIKEAIKYSFLDVDSLIELHDVLLKKIIDGGYEETYILHCRYIKALAYIEQCGLPISSELWSKKMLIDTQNASNYKKLIEEYIYTNIPQFRDSQLHLWDDEKRITISISSPVQMLRIFEALGIPTKDKDGKDSINENIISKSKHEFVKLWLDFQEANHRVTTFGEKILNKIENERIYTSFNPCVDTARLSTRKGHINFLNFPSDKITRNCFKATPGNIMVVCDLAGQENVLSADFTKDEAMMLAVKENRDLHCMLTRVLHPNLVDMSDEEIMTKHKAERQASKPIRFAFAYGGNAYTIHQNGNIPYTEALEIEKKYKELHKGIYDWGESVYNESVKNGYIESVAGWKLKLPKYDEFIELQKTIKSFDSSKWTIYRIGKEENKKKKEGFEKNEKYVIKDKTSYDFYKKYKPIVSKFFKLKSEYQRLCLNSPIQTAGAHQLKLATSLFFEWIKENKLLGKVLIVNSVHDELCVECVEQFKNIVKDSLEKCMINGANHFLSELKCGADAGIGNSWYEAK